MNDKKNEYTEQDMELSLDDLSGVSGGEIVDENGEESSWQADAKSIEDFAQHQQEQKQYHDITLGAVQAKIR